MSNIIKKNERVSDVITDNEISKWNNGDIVLISAGCGAGKSYFVKNKLYDVAKSKNKRILMLIHRKNPVLQFQQEIVNDNKTDIISIMTYQSLEHQIENGGFNFDEYKYIVCDEFHYFVSDASFSSSTDISLMPILHLNQSIKVFMSATGQTMCQVLKKYRNLKHQSISIVLRQILTTLIH